MASITISDITASAPVAQLRRDASLADALFEPGILGAPKFFAGGLAVVFPVYVGNKKLAYRCWFASLGNLNGRYQRIYEHIGRHDSRYIINSRYNPEGLVVNGILQPTMVMDWVEGQILMDWVAANYTNSTVMQAMGDKLLEMFRWLHQAQISHGDLQTDNIMVRPDGSLVLIDYDTICVPALVGEEDLLAGKKGFQHPARFAGRNRATLKADYFSELILYSGIIALSKNPKLYSDFKVGPGNDFFIIQDKDFLALDQSAAFQSIAQCSSECDILMDVMREYLAADNIEKLKPFYERYDALRRPPEIIALQVNRALVLAEEQVTIDWNVANSKTLELNYGAGIVTGQQSATITPVQSGYIRLQATNSFGTVEKAIWIDVQPQPAIIRFGPEERQIRHGSSTHLRWNVEHVSEVQLKMSDGIVSVQPHTGQIEIWPLKHEVYEMAAIGLDGFTKTIREAEVQVFRPVVIKTFELDRPITLETVPAELRWEIEEATDITIRTLRESWTLSLAGTKEVRPRETTRYILEAHNPLFTQNASCELIVDVLPRLNLSLPPLTERGIPIIPKLDFGADHFEDVLDADIVFADIFRTKKRFGAGDIAQKLLKLNKR